MTLDRQFQPVHTFGIDAMQMIPFNEFWEHSIRDHNQPLANHRLAEQLRLTEGDQGEKVRSSNRQLPHVIRVLLIVFDDFKSEWVTTSKIVHRLVLEVVKIEI